MKRSLIFDLELKQRMTWRQVNVVRFARIPAADDQAPRVRIRLNLINQPRYLIDAIASRIMAAERTPQISVNRPEVARFAPKSPRVFFIRPLFPDIDATRAQVRFVRVA